MYLHNLFLFYLGLCHGGERRYCSGGAEKTAEEGNQGGGREMGNVLVWNKSHKL